MTRLLAQLKRLVALHLSVQKPADNTGRFFVEVRPLRTALRARRRSQLAGSSGSAGSRCERHHQPLPASCCIEKGFMGAVMAMGSYSGLSLVMHPRVRIKLLLTAFTWMEW